MEQITRILDEDRGRNRLTTLEKTETSYKVKTVKVEFFANETAAREAYYKTIHPRRSTEAKKGRTAKK